jgi:diguanylate cyclase (GGDEF)-like protein
VGSAGAQDAVAPLNLSQRLVTLATVVCVAAIGSADMLTTPAVRFGALYVLPVAIASAYGLKGAGHIVAALAVAVDTTASWTLGVHQPGVLLLLAAIRGGAFLLVAELVRALQRDRARLRDLALTDHTTGLSNRHAFHTQAAAELRRCGGTGQPVSVLYLDVNDFKKINDAHGHHVGDQVLAEVARQLSLALRGNDLVARIGGDEFAVLLPDTDKAGAIAVSANITIRLRSSQPQSGCTASVSIGRSTSRPPYRLEQLLADADRDMYTHKSVSLHGNPADQSLN